MELIWQGILLGLGLSILVGPILVIYLQVGIERGLKAGLTVAAGVWFSDLLFILAMYFGLQYIQQIISIDGFEIWLGFAGAIILMALGLGMLFQKSEAIIISPSKSKKTYAGYFSKGFLVNTLNPFPFFFWSSVMTSNFSTNQDLNNIFLLFGSIMVTIVFTDLLKVFLAKKLRPVLTLKNITLLRHISGIVLLFLGLFLGISSFWRF